MLHLEPTHLALLFAFKFPQDFFRILLYLAGCPELTQKGNLHAVEYFAGVKAVTKGFRKQDLAAVSYELLDNRVTQDSWKTVKVMPLDTKCNPIADRDTHQSTY